MKNLLLLLSFSICFLCINCGNKNTNHVLKLNPSKKLKNFKLTKDINPVLSNATFPYSNSNGRYLGFCNSTTNEIILFNFEKETIFKRIKFAQKEKDKIGEIDGFEIVNFDSIFITCNNVHAFWLTDSSAKIKKRYNYGKSNDSIPVISSFSAYNYPNTPFIINKNKVYMTQFSLGVDFSGFITSAGRIKDSRVCQIYYLDSDKTYYLPMTVPVNYWDNGFYFPYFSRVFFNGMFVYSFFHDEKIYVTSDHKTIQSYSAKSNYMQKKLISYDKQKTFEDVEKTSLNNPEYRSIYYDKYRNLFYRIVYPGFEAKSNDNIRQKIQFPEWFSIIILDENFNVRGETNLEPNKYFIRNMFVEKEGLYISTNHINNPDYSDDYLSFELFEVDGL